MTHGVRKGIHRGTRCPTGKSAYTDWDVAEAARIRLDAERVYRCSGCGYLHVTRDTEAEYAQKVAGMGCTPVTEDGTVVSSTDDGSHDEQAEGREPRSRRGDAGAAPVVGKQSSRPSTPQAAFARILAAPRHP